MSIVENIKSLCAKNDTSIPKLEKELGFGRGAIYNRDKNSPAIDKVQKVADYFRVTTDFLSYGFERKELSLYANWARGDLSIDAFAELAGIDRYEFKRLCDGVYFNQPPLETVIRIANCNQNPIILSSEMVLQAAGYGHEVPNLVRNNTSLSDKQTSISPKQQTIDTIAAHLEDKNITPKKLKLLEQYIDALFEEDEDN